MDLGMPLATLAPTLDLRVLEGVARSTQAYGLGELTAFVGASRPGVRLAADRLVDGGLVELVTIGRTRGYRLNRDHVLAEVVLGAVAVRGEIRRRIVDAVGRWEVPARCLVLFGSMARGEADASSDLDLLVLHDPAAPDDPRWPAQVADLASAVRSWTGNGCDVLTFSTQEWDDLIAQRHPFATEVARDGVDLDVPVGTAA